MIFPSLGQTTQICGKEIFCYYFNNSYRTKKNSEIVHLFHLDSVKQSLVCPLCLLVEGGLDGVQTSLQTRGLALHLL